MDWTHPASVLLDGEVREGDTPPRRAPAQGASAPAAGGAEAAGGRGLTDGFNFELFTGECREHSPCLGATRAADTMVYGGGEPETLRMREGRDGGGKGPLVSKNVSLALATSNDQALLEKREAAWWDGSDKAGTLTVTSDGQRMPDKGRLQSVVDTRQLEAETDGGVSPTLLSTDYKGGKAVVETPGGASPENAVCPTLEANLFNKNTFQDCDKLLIERNGDAAVCFTQNQRDEVRLLGGDGEVAGSVCAMQATKQQNLIAYENHPQDGRVKESGDVSPTLTGQMGTGGNNCPWLQSLDSHIPINNIGDGEDEK